MCVLLWSICCNLIDWIFVLIIGIKFVFKLSLRVIEGGDYGVDGVWSVGIVIVKCSVDF